MLKNEGSSIVTRRYLQNLIIDHVTAFTGSKAKYVGRYRITDDESLNAAMCAAGGIMSMIAAKLSVGPSICNIRRHGDNSRLHDVSVSVTSGNFLAAKV
jgi:amino-acid N-acetyltransferase